MHTPPLASPFRRLLVAAALLALVLPAEAVRTAVNVSTNATVNWTSSNQNLSTIPAHDSNLTNNVVGAENGDSITIDFTGYVTEEKPMVCVTEIAVTSSGGGTYSLFTSEDGTTWKSVTDAQGVRTTGTKTYPIGLRVLKVKYVFDTTPGTDLRELEVRGWLSTKPAQISRNQVARSIFFRDGHGTRGNAGFNGGSYSTSMFDGNFTGGLYQNGAGAELVFSTKMPDSVTGIEKPWYVTEVLVGHKGNTKYSLYYTTEEEPANILDNAKDPRSWTLIEGANQVQEAGTKTYLVNKTVTAVKYVFDTALSWTQSACELEVRAMDPDDLACMHENFNPATATWTQCAPPTCTENAFEESFCPDCGVRFEREVPLSKLGHDFVATLTRPGRHDRWGSGYVTCARTIQDTNTLEVVWSCDYRIDFTTNDVDLTTLGGPPINGVVQYTDLTVSSIGAQDGGIKPEYLMDNAWTAGWGGAFYFETLSVNEYAQYAFGTKIELTKIEFSVLNQDQTVYLYKFDPDTGVETLLKSIPIEKITTYEDREDPETGEITQVNTSPGYQRMEVDFFVSDKAKKIVVDAVRMRIGDYVDPKTGEVKHYSGLHYGGSDIHTIICEFHPWGTIEGAGPLTYPPTTIMLLR